MRYMSNECSIVDCEEAVTHKAAEMKRPPYYINVALCDKHFKQYAQKFKNPGSVIPDYFQFNTGGGLNIAGILSNALAGLASPDKSKHLISVLQLVDGQDHTANITNLIKSASTQQVDLAPRMSSMKNSEELGELLNSGWWGDFLDEVKITKLDNVKKILDQISNSVSHITEANIISRAVGAVRDVVSNKPNSMGGRGKNALVAKTAIAAVCDIYDELINKILAKRGLSVKSLPALLQIFTRYIAPVLQTKRAFGQTDAEQQSKGDQKLCDDILNSYQTIDRLQRDLKILRL
jgi:hypothetical protein